jgi:PAS domain S-box-containing protein
MSTFTIHTPQQGIHIEEFLLDIKNKSDRIVNYFLASFFISGIGLGFFYDTWNIAFSVGGLLLIAYYSTKLLLPHSDLYQYVLSAVFGLFMAQFIYQMHGMFEMHFIAFIGSAMLITYQKWRLQFPILFIVILHHGIFAYLQFSGYKEVYFTQQNFMDLPTFIIHLTLAAVIFFISALWAYHFKRYSEAYIEQGFKIGKLEEETLQRKTLVALSKNLQTTVEHLREAQEISHLGNWNWNIKTNTVTRSDEIYNILERRKKDISDNPQGFLQCIHPLDRYIVQKSFNQALEKQIPFKYEARIVTPDNKIKTIFSQAKLILNESGELTEIYGTIQDITHMKQTEAKLEAANKELNMLFNSVEEVLFSVDMITNKVTQISPACEKVYGYEAKEFYADVDLYNKVVLPDDLYILDGHKEILRIGRDLRNQYRIIHKDGSIRWIENTVIPTLNNERKLIRLDGVTRDITNQKNNEQEINALNESLDQKVKERTNQLQLANKELEAFSYSVSHDLRAPLRIISGFGQIILKEEKDAISNNAKENLLTIISHAKHMDQLINELLNFSRCGKLAVAKRQTDMTGIVNIAIEEIKSVMEDFKAEFVLKDLPGAECDSVLIKQVWTNLLSNAVKYSGKKENPVIEIGTRNEDNSTIYYVKDNGAGFDMSLYEKLFGAFQRLHQVSEYEGIGIGLALVQRIITNHGGKIWAEAKVNEGATFYFTLPN